MTPERELAEKVIRLSIVYEGISDSDSFQDQVEDIIKEAVEKEREECARVADDPPGGCCDCEQDAKAIAEKIRRRGE